MKIFSIAILLISATAASAQQWEIGATGGMALTNNVNVSGGPAAATAGFAPGYVAGAFIGQNMKGHLSGEIRYEYMKSDLRLDSAGQRASFAGTAHAVHYDFVLRSNRNNHEDSPFNVFLAVGGGLKAYFANGTESATQPLSQFGYFTKGHSTMAMGTAAVGANIRLSSHVMLRAEVRDFITSFPTGVITAPAGVTYGSMLHEIVPMVSIVYTTK